jgi:hypothetical protein
MKIKDYYKLNKFKALIFLLPLIFNAYLILIIGNCQKRIPFEKMLACNYDGSSILFFLDIPISPFKIIGNFSGLNIIPILFFQILYWYAASCGFYYLIQKFARQK